MADIADVQAKIDAGNLALSKTTNTYPYMVRKYGSDWKKWPVATQWYIALSNFAAARSEVAKLQKLTAEFSYK
jgi:hypothetical protein